MPAWSAMHDAVPTLHINRMPDLRSHKMKLIRLIAMHTRLLGEWSLAIIRLKPVVTGNVLGSCYLCVFWGVTCTTWAGPSHRTLHLKLKPKSGILQMLSVSLVLLSRDPI
jgi:hypothetical protein